MSIVGIAKTIGMLRPTINWLSFDSLPLSLGVETDQNSLFIVLIFIVSHHNKELFNIKLSKLSRLNLVLTTHTSPPPTHTH